MKRILVIEDDPALREMLCQTLVQAGYQVEAAADGKKASAIYGVNPPDIAVTDIYMPTKDGLETLIDLRQNFPEVKIIAISGGVSKTHILEVAKILGAACTLIKPFEPAELIQAVEQLAH